MAGSSHEDPSKLDLVLLDQVFEYMLLVHVLDSVCYARVFANVVV